MSRDFERFPVPALSAVGQQADSNPFASVYLPRTSGKMIVCPTICPDRGLYVEQTPVALISPDAPADTLGQSVWEALLSFRASASPDLASRKKTDWPAYRASGVKTVRAFEGGYVHVSVEAFPCVLRVEATVPARAAEGLFVGRFITNACDFGTLGELIQLVCRCSLQIAEREYG